MRGVRFNLRLAMAVVAGLAVILGGLRCILDIPEMHHDYHAQKAVSSLRMERHLRQEAAAARRAAAEALETIGHAEPSERERLRSLAEDWTAKAERTERWATEEAQTAQEALTTHLSSGRRLSELPEWILRELVEQPMESR